MKNYPKTLQLRDVVRKVKESHDYQGVDIDGNAIFKHVAPYPKLEFKGSVKIHGTNAAFVKYKNRLEFQSRNRVISTDDDNAGFASHFSNKNLTHLFDRFEFNEYVAIYGEWAGKGIQKGVAVGELDKIFVIFAVCIDDNWIEVPTNLLDIDKNIFNIHVFKTFDLTIDFNNPDYSLEEIQKMVLEVEAECPVGKHFGISGIGEGIVFTCASDNKIKFKAKGEKHSVTKTKNVANIDVEKINSVRMFVDYSVTENRLSQAIEFLKETKVELTYKTTGSFLSWVFSDIVAEESDTLDQNGLSKKDVSTKIAERARKWYFEYLDKNL